jgi:hypothetical protein
LGDAKGRIINLVARKPNYPLRWICNPALTKQNILSLLFSAKSSKKLVARKPNYPFTERLLLFLKSVSGLTGSPLAQTVGKVTRTPVWGPVLVLKCDG